MFLWPFALFNSAASFTKQDFESMDYRYTDPKYRNPTSFHSKVSTQTLVALVPFFPFFSDFLGF
jgi:hypothetical protein